MNGRQLREKWNRIYEKATQELKPAVVVEDYLELLPKSGRALDIACGRGANALYLAERGLSVDAWDLSDVAIQQLNESARSRGLPVDATRMQITAEALSGQQWDVIVNCHFLDRNLTAAIKSAVKPGGVVLFQTFTVNKKIDAGPSNPDFLLMENELQAMFDDFEELASRDLSDCIDPDNALCGRALIVARKPT